jgi:SAM-dependent methyltransferase
MLRGLRRRARRKGLEAILETRLCTQEDPRIDDLRDGVDVAVAFHVLHETRDPERVVGAIANALRPGGRLLLAEPVGHVSHDTLEFVFGLPPAAGLVPLDGHVRRRSRLGVFERPD